MSATPWQALRPAQPRRLTEGVAALFVALTLAGLGRALATGVSFQTVHDGLPGVHVPICRSGADETLADPARPASQERCDRCALPAIAVLPTPSVLSRPAPLDHFAAHARALGWPPVLARLRDPRLARGPPTA